MNKKEKRKNGVPERSALPIDKTWDLSPLYPSVEEWERDFVSLDSLLANFLSYKGKLGISAHSLAEAFKSLDSLYRLFEKIYVFAHLQSDENTANSETRARLERASTKGAEIHGAVAWFEPEILNLPEEKIEAYLKSPSLSFYRRTLTELLRKRSHTLSAPEERILGMASDSFATPHKIFSILNDADLRFPYVPDGTGKKIEVTHGNYRKLMENPDRKVRKTAFCAMYDTFSKFRNTFASVLDGAVKTHILKAKLRNFPSALEASLHPDNIPVKVYENLISAVHKHFPAFYKYLDLRRRALSLDKLDMYDIYNPIVSECRIEVPWEQAHKWVCEALRPMGKDYCENLEQAFKGRWIDVLECRGKRSGAYSSGCYDSVPYILMNFDGILNGVFTLAHELGHSMHSYYSHKSQEYHYADYRIFVAEVASITNELLLHHYLMERSDDINFRLYLLNHLADEIRGTVYRQTMFAEFEKNIHERREMGIPLTADELCSSYFELNAKYHGDIVDPDKRIEMEWARIPHFYYNFYVYKYATGFAAAASLSKGILNADQTKLEVYMEFLRAGSTKDVLDILKDAGVDLSTPEPVNAALEEFADTVEALEQGILPPL